MKKLFSIFGSMLLAFSWLLLTPIPVAHAVGNTCTWTGTTSNLWSVSTNWSGCGGVAPVTNDDLVFPSATLNQSMNNDLSIIANDITVNGSGYTFGGNTVELSRNLNIFSTTTFSSQVKFSGSSGIGQLNVQGATPTFSSGIDLNLTGTAFFTAFTTSISLDLPVFTGTTTGFYLGGNPTAPIELYNSSLSASSFTASAGVHLSRASFNCRATNCLGASTNIVTIAGADAAGLYLDLNKANLVFANPIVFDNTGLTGPSKLRVSQDATVSGGITLANDAIIDVQPSVAMQLNSTVALGGGSPNTMTYTVGSGGQITHNGTITGTGNIVANGYLDLINSNSYSGTTTVNSGALLIISNAGGLGTTAGATTVNNGGTLQFNLFAAGSTAENITASGTGRAGSSGALEVYNLTNNVNLTGNVTLAGDTSIGQGLSGSANFNFNGVIGGTGNITINGFNASSFSFGGTSANTYVGNTTITGGQLNLNKTAGVTAITGDVSALASPSGNAGININNANQIADSSNVVLDTNTGIGSLTLSADETVATVTGDGYIGFSAGTNLTTNSSSNYTFAGSMAKASVGADPQFIKTGPGTATLTGTLPASGIGYPRFVVNGGKLLANANFATTSFVSNSGGTLGGSGSTGATSVNSGGTINVGNSPGCMTVASLNLISGANFTEELAGNMACTQYDQTTVTGTANLNNATLNVVPSFNPSVGTVFTIIQAGNVTGTFSGLANGATTTASGIQFRVNYTATTVTLTVLGGTLAQTGQPTNWITIVATLLLISSAAGLLIVWRRKQLFHKSQ